MKIEIKSGLSQIQAIKSVRVVWGFNPVSRVVRDKSRYSRKEKHKGKGWE
jgi:formylmethanofuran dehydrogenase subunit B